MNEKQFIRTVAGQIYDTENEKFYHEDYEGKPIEYEDEVVDLLNELAKENKQLKKEKDYYKRELQKDLVCQAIIDGREKND